MRTFNVTGLPMQVNASSNGDQRKWHIKTDKEDIYVKEQLFLKVRWKDNLVEKIASAICRQLDIDWLRYSEYELCEIVDDSEVTQGCYSYSFLKESEELVTLYNMMLTTNTTLLSSDDIPKIYLKLLNTFTDFGIEKATDYLSVLFLVDYLLCNTDRHLSNITAIRYEHGYKSAPMFDFGQGLFQGSFSHAIMPVQEMMHMLSYKPYMRSFEDVMKFYWSQGTIRSYIPKELDVTGLQFPDFNSAIVLGLQCKSLNIKLKGVERQDVSNKFG